MYFCRSSVDPLMKKDGFKWMNQVELKEKLVLKRTYRLKDLERESGRLEKALAEFTLDKQF